MIRDLLTPDNHRDPYVWGAVLLAHAQITLVLWGGLAALAGPWVAVALVSAGYLLVWEGAQLRSALRRGDKLAPALADGVVDWIGVTAGAYAAACLLAGDLLGAVLAWMSLLIVAAVGYYRRSK
ncbi:MAG: hypothetical protein Q4G24_10575 [Paracoccus sp. (in: a-proteobacteria)]|uniref:hypothetical protein n=1 Tax=Paracoccus sp. TaxID=267 RepID=UPI0026E00809|nr:hypothetical protein [Paracoccus sp. (in: a-proteobacteria)]MDO5621902.1 hypothetical protein [Paracoccus sp. (in: a-proteobacteria)]